MRGELAGRVGDVHDLGGRRAVLAAELAVAEPEVQRRADDDDQVGLAERDRPGPGDQQLVPGRQDAAALAVGDHRQPQLLGRARGRPPRRRRARRPSPGPAPAGWRRGQQRRDLGDRVRRRARSRGRGARRTAPAAGAGRAGPPSPPAAAGAEQRFQADVQEHRAAVPRRGQPEGLAHRRPTPAARARSRPAW